ncbi:MAG: argininosuccinate lyase [Gemmatimonadetes bacterium]|nr:argininosuccinate lyase [Gemmatimonadota bacterium]NIO30561.1 argininosuccinate lyase [Gemmatimonadota bacterium]
MGVAGDENKGTEQAGFQLWGTRFQSGLAPEAEAFNRSLPVDSRLWREELEVAAAWVEALAVQGVLESGEAEALTGGLERVAERLAGHVADTAPDEDIHTLVERLLTDEVGELAGKLRTGRSRNDQAATATRLWVRRAVDDVDGRIARLQTALLTQAEATIDLLVPSYTHLRRAQPIRLAHFFLSHFWPLQRDRARWAQVRNSASVMPLGAGAVAGSGFPLDRDALKERLGFVAVAPNSIDAVSDRDFVAELAFAGALLGAHLSRLAEDLIVFSSSEFGFLRFADPYSTGSSLMPQKRNPDIAELARGRSAGLLADVTAALALLKGLPTGYNKDLQEDKSILFGAYDALHLLLPAFAGAVETLEVDAGAAAAVLDPSVLAVDLADALVRAGVTFRDAHAAVGALVGLAEKEGVSILGVEAEKARELHPALPGAITALGEGSTAYEKSVESRSISGGTARAAILEQIKAARSALSSFSGT